jgi:glutaredoxin
VPYYAELKLITRQGCHLCEEASNDLARVIARFTELHPDKEYSVDVVDVDSDPELISKYSEEVPVLLLNGRQISFFKIDIERVLAQLENL